MSRAKSKICNPDIWYGNQWKLSVRLDLTSLKRLCIPDNVFIGKLCIIDFNMLRICNNRGRTPLILPLDLALPDGSFSFHLASVYHVNANKWSSEKDPFRLSFYLKSWNRGLYKGQTIPSFICHLPFYMFYFPSWKKERLFLS